MHQSRKVISLIYPASETHCIEKALFYHVCKKNTKIHTGSEQNDDNENDENDNWSQLKITTVYLTVLVYCTLPTCFQKQALIHNKCPVYATLLSHSFIILHMCSIQL